MNPVSRLDDHSCAIFLFHGVVEPGFHRVRNYTHKHLSVSAFENVLTDIAAAGNCISMDEVACHIERKEPFAPRSFAITFDDGFENNRSVAAPILRRFDMPATFYVTTDLVDRNAMSWIDRIEYCLERAEPGCVQLPWLSVPFVFRTVADKIEMLDTMRAHVKRDKAVDRERLVASIFEQCVVTDVETSDDPLDRKLSWDQVKELAADPLFTVGGHSHTHATLSFLNAADLHAEIETSLRLLRECAKIETEHYSYPEGLPYCYSPLVIEVLRSFRIRACPTAIDGTNDEHSDLFHLRRIMVADVGDGSATHECRDVNVAGASV